MSPTTYRFWFHYVDPMSVERLPRGTRSEPKKLGYLVAGLSKQDFEEMAQAAGVSGAVFFERVAAHLKEELDDRGAPSWWPKPTTRDGELPIEAA